MSLDVQDEIDQYYEDIRELEYKLSKDLVMFEERQEIRRRIADIYSWIQFLKKYKED